MSKLKDITKELTGRALSPFHRKTGLNQLERNNEMQDGILDGILSQVDDAYITKTEQSNIMHLENSGDGVVVLDSIEGNTMVNILNKNATISTNGNYQRLMLKPSNNITVINNFQKSVQLSIRRTNGEWLRLQTISTGITNYKLNSEEEYYLVQCPIVNTNQQEFSDAQILILEGDWTNKEVSYFEGLQSSFEEKVNSEGKYEIEISSRTSKNLYELKTVNYDWGFPITPTTPTSPNDLSYHCCEYFDVTNLRNKRVYGAMFRDGVLRNNGINFICFFDENNQRIGDRYSMGVDGYIIPSNAKLMSLMQNCGGSSKTWISRDKYCLSLQPFVNEEKLVEHKLNKIKVLVNEPLRSTPHGVKDRLCIKNSKLVVERKCGEITLDGTENWEQDICYETFGQFRIGHNEFVKKNKPLNKLYTTTYEGEKIVCNNYACGSKKVSQSTLNIGTMFAGDSKNYAMFIKLSNSQLGIPDEINVNLFTQKVKELLANKNATIIYELAEPIYEEVLNEYGEPILLEGYEDGTLYIDSTITPTTTVRYTPKMEAFSVCNEIQENNVALSSDINDNIITYMMEVDYMITEKELNSASVCSVTQRMEVLDMTSMQKRTFDMLARLFKGKSLTKEECETRVTVYLSAGKITDEQAEELMLLIAETYQ